MTYRKLLLPLTADAAGEAALATGLMLAQRWGAHIACVAVQVDSRDVAPLAGDGLSGTMIQDMMTATDQQNATAARQAEALFTRLMSLHGVQVTGDAVAGEDGPSASFVARVGRDEELVPALARLCDLTVLPHPKRESDAAGSDALHAVLFDSGRPVLIAPREAPTSLGRRCAVAWNGTHQGAAALAAMLPWLRQADAVRVLHAAEYQRRAPPAADVVPYLALHGVTADVAEFRVEGGAVGAGLLAGAADFGADLLGMGAYAHSRLRQAILGGVTRHVLGNAGLSVLMSR